MQGARDHMIPERLRHVIERDNQRQTIQASMHDQAKAMSVAVWETSLRGKIASKEEKRRQAEIQEEIRLTAEENLRVRRERLRQLFDHDALIIEKELADRGLAIWRQRS
ncbi:hypothetical protein PAPYR_6788 [Paratrimastix pyriformis]|uniref:Uncharacterized protein n=1 Tax=Paratrimastix pyriformis TaxID=342808 RepID=A0ABQ8UHJ1_9EUKA|nr:hypothetical protein PAPYR_6788 [Paratrimastix pyriformis]